MDEALFLCDPASDEISDRDVIEFVGPVAVYVVHSPNRSFGAYAGAYRKPLSKADVDDIREWTQADVSGPFASHRLALTAVQKRLPMSGHRFTIHGR